MNNRRRLLIILSLLYLAGCSAFPTAPGVDDTRDADAANRDVSGGHEPEIGARPDTTTDVPADAADTPGDIPAPNDADRPPVDTGRDALPDTDPDPDVPPDSPDADQPDFGDGPCAPMRSAGLTLCRESEAHCETHAPLGRSCEEICSAGGLTCDYRVASSSQCVADGQVATCDSDSPEGVCLCRHCERQCGAFECGNDGCGGVCGNCDQGDACVDGFCEARPWTLLLGEAEGYGAEVTGGALGSLCEVSTDADAGRGSLRECLGTGNVWIRFLDSYRITLQSPLLVLGNTTIDGRGQHITVSGDTIEVRGEQNVILNNLIVDGLDYEDRHGIHVRNGSRRVWLNHLSILRVGDSGVRVTDNSSDITVSWCWFTQLTRGLNVGSGAESVNTRITVHHSLFRNVERYTPRIRWGRMHAYNNIIDNWSIIGAAVTEEGQFLSESNAYDESERVPAVTVEIFEDTERGFVRSQDDVVYGETFVQINAPERVEAPGYRYTLQPAGDIISDVNRLVGYQEVEFPGR